MKTKNQPTTWKLYKWNGHYIMGDLISKHTTEAAAIKRAKKEIDFVKTEKTETKTEIKIWLDGDFGNPMGVIFAKKKDKKGV